MEDRTILIIDDDNYVIKALSRELMDEPYGILSAGSGEEGLEIIKNNDVQLVVVDENMPGMGGTTFLTIIRREYPDIVRIMLTGRTNIESLMSTVNKGEVYRFFTKPWREVDILLAIRQGLEKYSLEEERRILLATVKMQNSELSRLEQEFPGITDIKEDNTGAIVLPMLSEEEVKSIMEDCRRKSD